MKHNSLIVIILFLSFELLEFAGTPSAAQTISNLVGTWEYKLTDSYTLKMIFRNNGTGTFDEEEFNYSVTKNKLTLTNSGEITTYSFSLNENRLTLSGGDFPQPMTFVCAGKAENAAPLPSISQENPQQESGTGSNAMQLIGRWKGPEGIVEFKENGKAIIKGQNYLYSANSSIITLTGNDGSIEIPYSIVKKQLLVTINNESLVLTRVETNTQNQSAGAGGIAMELVGKWCYMANVNANNGGRMSNECITFYENGTYEYYRETSSSGQYGSTATQESDGGTWVLDGDQLKAQSRNNGPLQYTLEKMNHPKNTNDPMIVLDGKAFVTVSPRAPW